jgi:hypothetical protein
MKPEGPIVYLGGQPLVYRPLGAEKRTALRLEMLHLAGEAGVRDKAQWDQFVRHYDALAHGMMRAIDPQATNPVTAALTAAVTSAAPALQGGALATIQSILLNRRDDLLSSRALLADASFTDGLYAEYAALRMPISGALGPLPATKQQELMETMLQPRNGRLEPAAHIHATAYGHAVAHDALAKAFSPSGPVGHLLKTTLASQAQGVPESLTQHFATRWLTIRHTRARQVAEAYAHDSPLVQSAIQLSEENRMQQAQAMPALGPVAALTAPTEQPRTVIQTVLGSLQGLLQPLLNMGRSSPS